MHVNTLIWRDLRKKIIHMISYAYICILSIFEILDSEWLEDLVEKGNVEWRYSTIVSLIMSICCFIGIITFVFFGCRLEELYDG